MKTSPMSSPDSTGPRRAWQINAALLERGIYGGKDLTADAIAFEDSVAGVLSAIKCTHGDQLVLAGR